MILPLLLVLVVLFLGGILIAAKEGLAAKPGLFEDPELRAAVGFTLWIAAVSTLLSTLTGVAIALALHTKSASNRHAALILQIPIAMPHLTMAVALISLASPSGILSRLAYASGIIHTPAQFPDIVQDPFAIGIILTFWLKETPFIALTSLALLAGSGRDYEAVAQTLGAGPWARLRCVTLPLLAPAFLPASLIVFAFVFSSYDVPFLLGRNYPTVLSVVAQRYFQSTELAGQSAGMAISTFMTMISSAIAAIYLRVFALSNSKMVLP